MRHFLVNISTLLFTEKEKWRQKLSDRSVLLNTRAHGTWTSFRFHYTTKRSGGWLLLPSAGKGTDSVQKVPIITWWRNYRHLLNLCVLHQNEMMYISNMLECSRETILGFYTDHASLSQTKKRPLLPAALYRKTFFYISKENTTWRSQIVIIFQQDP